MSRPAMVVEEEVGVRTEREGRVGNGVGRLGGEDKMVVVVMVEKVVLVVVDVVVFEDVLRLGLGIDVTSRVSRDFGVETGVGVRVGVIVDVEVEFEFEVRVSLSMLLVLRWSIN